MKADPGRGTAERYTDLEELRASITDLGRTRRRFQKAGRRYTAQAAPVDDLEIAAADLLRGARIAEKKLRRSLRVLMLQYADLWCRGGCGKSEGGQWAQWVLASGFERMRPLADLAGKSSEVRSLDGRVTAAVDVNMRLVDLDFAPDLMADPDYKASLLEAVNSAVRPIYRANHGTTDALMAELPPPEPMAMDDSEMEPALGAIWGLIWAQEKLAKLLAAINDGEELSRLAERNEEAARATQEEERDIRREIKTLRRFRRRLHAKADLSGVTPEDLADVAALKDLFGKTMLDDLGDLVDMPLGNAGRELIEQVGAQLKCRYQQDMELLRFKRYARLHGHRIAIVEAKTYEGRSSDGSVTARVAGTVRLVDVTLDSNGKAEPEQVKAGVIEAVNSAFKTVVSRRRFDPMQMMWGDLLG